jgi:hypothetical protein
MNLMTPFCVCLYVYYVELPVWCVCCVCYVCYVRRVLRVFGVSCVCLACHPLAFGLFCSIYVLYSIFNGDLIHLISFSLYQTSKEVRVCILYCTSIEFLINFNLQVQFISIKNI